MVSESIVSSDMEEASGAACARSVLKGILREREREYAQDQRDLDIDRQLA
jgi:hypothetical protein